MPEKILPIQFPFKGLSDNVGFSEQPQGTTRDAQNVRGIDPTNGRIRGAQRSGMSKFNTNQINGSNKIADLQTVVFDSKNITYSQIADGSLAIDWQAEPFTKTFGDISGSGVSHFSADLSGSLSVVSDRQGNVYALDGAASVTKYNSVGERLFTISLPTQDDVQVVRALHVDDFDCIYAGVSDAGTGDDVRMWKYRQTPDDNFEQVWEIAPGSHVEAMKVEKDTLYVALNNVESRIAFLRAYIDIDSNSPNEVWESRAAYPINDMDVTEGGICVASDANSTRTENPLRTGPPTTSTTSRRGAGPGSGGMTSRRRMSRGTSRMEPTSCAGKIALSSTGTCS
jgi:hypothetical protein